MSPAEKHRQGSRAKTFPGIAGRNTNYFGHYRKRQYASSKIKNITKKAPAFPILHIYPNKN